MSELVTFAGPRVGDAAFASSFDAALGKQTTTNLYHDLDPVLAQNQPLWDALGFVHAGRTAAGQGGLARCPLCPGWLAAPVRQPAASAARPLASGCPLRPTGARPFPVWMPKTLCGGTPRRRHSAALPTAETRLSLV